MIDETNKQSSNPQYSRLLGFDGNFWFNPALKGELLLARTFNPSNIESDFLGIGRLVYSQYNIDADLRFYAVGPQFVPEMGFVIQNDLKRSSAVGSYTHWINQKKVRSLIYSGCKILNWFLDPWSASLSLTKSKECRPCSAHCVFLSIGRKIQPAF